MPQANVNGIEIEYVTEGDPSDPPLLLVMGLGAQLTTWPEGFVDGLRQRGFFVIRFDNRDSGLSTKFEGLPDIAALFTGTDLSSALYRIEDMADDAAALLGALGIAQGARGRCLHGRHDHPGPGDQPPGALPHAPAPSCRPRATVPWARPTGEAMTALLRPVATSREEAIEASVEGSLRHRFAGVPDRRAPPAGAGRRGVRPLLLPRGHGPPAGRHPRLTRSHGGAARCAASPFSSCTVRPIRSSPRAVARRRRPPCPGSKLLTIPGMGHDLPEPLWDTITDAIVANTELAAV